MSEALVTGGPERGGGDQAAAVIRLLAAREDSVATAESLTGGGLCVLLTAVPGASRVVRGAVVSYVDEVKATVLGVPRTLLDEYGAVSAQTAVAMAVGARDLLGAAYAASTTGVAGPDPAEGKPVGTVFVAVVGPSATRCQRLRLSGDRDAIRAESARAALALLRRTLEEPGGPGEPEEVDSTER